MITYIFSDWTMLFVLLFLVGGVFCSEKLNLDWKSNYANLYCRDQGNIPVDWWILYKPPKGDGPTWSTGQNFTYITSNEAGMWQLSNQEVTSSYMLQQNFSPLFRPAYHDRQAMIAYQSEVDEGAHHITSPLMFADDMGGVWISHTVPGLLDFTNNNYMYFPESEIDNGHLIMCLSLDLYTLNAISKSLKTVGLKVSIVQVPPAIRQWLPDWGSMGDILRNFGDYVKIDSLVNLSSKLDFVTKERSLKASLVLRWPGDNRCLFNTFAKNKKIVLDVYGHDRRTKTVCEQAYSVRNIDAISLKLFTMSSDVYYVSNKTDRIGFAVSTAAQWQRSGDSKGKYWTCIGTSSDRSGRGEFIVCIEDFRVWRSFDTLKVKEPEC